MKNLIKPTQYLAIILAMSSSTVYAAETKPDQATDEKAEIAVEAFEQEDAGPIEDWFGCPPVEKDDGDAEKNETNETIDENCDPDNPINHSPQKSD